MFGDCRETVSILYALVFGADGACVMLSTWSILTAFGAFIGLVVVAQFIARRLWAWMWEPTVAPRISPDVPTPHQPSPMKEPVQRGQIVDDPNYRDSAIRSSKR